RKMKDSGVEWIGKIPEDWNIIILKRTIKSRMGGAWGDTPKNNENDIICIRIADFEYTKLKIKQNVTYTKRNYANDTINKLTLKKGDIL
ncbi:hypothetical protein, partial [Vallitalea sediminicola]